MKYRQNSGKAATHPRREIRRLKAQVRAGGLLRIAEVDLCRRISDLEIALRQPQGGRRHGNTLRTKRA